MEMAHMDVACSRRSFFALLAAAGLSQAAAPDELAGMSIAQVAPLLRSRTISPVELTQACLARIQRLQAELNAFITITPDTALARAKEMESEIARGKWRGPLHGVPLALKDNIDTAGLRTTAASNVFRDRVPAQDAEVVRRLRDAGAVFLGKLNLHEFAYGGTSAVTAFGPVRNPWDKALTPGGSSGGPGVAVAADLCFGALGTDTAGSVRIPASYCGIVGLKPTHGRSSLRGVIPLSGYLDHVGPMTKTVEDTAILLQAIAGYDAADTTTLDVPVPNYRAALVTARAKAARLRVGIPRAPFFDALHPDVAKAMEEALGVVAKITASRRDVAVPQVNAGPVLGVDAYAYHEPYFTRTPELYQPGVRAALERTKSASAVAYSEGLRSMMQARRDITKLFRDVDVLVLPTMADPPFRVEEGLTKNVSARNTSIFDVLGIPMISVPCGFTQNGLPIGMQIGAAPWAETTVLQLAHAYERATEWHRKPKL